MRQKLKLSPTAIRLHDLLEQPACSIVLPAILVHGKFISQAKLWLNFASLTRRPRFTCRRRSFHCLTGISQPTIWCVRRVRRKRGIADAYRKKRLNAVAGIPIYEAKSTRDLRIVYQVALHTDAEAFLERQVLRIWGILTHAQIDGRLWSAVSQELGNGKSAEYRRRFGFCPTH